MMVVDCGDDDCGDGQRDLEWPALLRWFVERVQEDVRDIL